MSAICLRYLCELFISRVGLLTTWHRRERCRISTSRPTSRLHCCLYCFILSTVCLQTAVPKLSVNFVTLNCCGWLCSS